MMNEVLPGQLLTNLNSLHIFSYENQLASINSLVNSKWWAQPCPSSCFHFLFDYAPSVMITKLSMKT